jgi:HEAT repeat protein
MRRFFHAAIAALALSSGAAHAVPTLYLPTPGPAGEHYAGAPFVAGASTLAGKAEEALKALALQLPDVSAIAVTYAGNTAALKLELGRQADPALRDRALGAVFFTLRSLGFDEVRLDSAVLSASSFTRPAMRFVAPLTAAIAAERLTHGLVDLDGDIIPAGVFYARVDAQDKDLTQTVRRLLVEGAPDVRLALVMGLDALKQRDREGLLGARLSDSDVRVRKAALAHLVKAPTVSALKLLAAYVDQETDNANRLEAARALVKAGRTEFSRYQLLDALTGADIPAARKAAEELAASKDPKFLPALAGLLRHADAGLRETGLSLLVTAGTFAPLSAALDDEGVPAPTREAVAEAIVAKGPADARAKALGWLVSLGSEAAAVRAADAIAAGPVGGTGESLRRGLGRIEKGVREAASKAAAKVRDPAALEALSKAFSGAKDAGEKQLYTVSAAEIIAGQSLDQALVIVKTTDAFVREVTVRALVAFAGDARPNPRVVDALKAGLGDASLAIRQAAAEALSKVADDAIGDELLKLKGDADARIRAAVIAGVARTKLPKADEAIIAALDDSDATVKEAALAAVLARRIEAAHDKARWLVTHREMPVRRAALAALVAIAKPGSPALFELFSKTLNEPDETLQLLALDGLRSYQPDAKTANAIGTPLVDSRAAQAVQLKALQVLVALGGPEVVDHVVLGLVKDDVEVKTATLAALEQLKHGKSVRSLQEFVKQESDVTLRERASKLLEVL